MTAIEQDLLSALHELEAAVLNTRDASRKPNLLPLFARLDELTARLPNDTDPTLSHYLQRKSYEKARRFLEGRDAENQAGACRH